jgi:hypothetical protein
LRTSTRISPGLDQPFLAFLDNRFLADQRIDRVCHPPRQNSGRRTLRRRIEGRRPVFLLDRHLGRDHLPEIDGAGVADAVRSMHHRLAAGAQAPGILRRT